MYDNKTSLQKSWTGLNSGVLAAVQFSLKAQLFNCGRYLNRIARSSHLDFSLFFINNLDFVKRKDDRGHFRFP